MEERNRQYIQNHKLNYNPISSGVLLGITTECYSKKFIVSIGLREGVSSFSFKNLYLGEETQTVGTTVTTIKYSYGGEFNHNVLEIPLLIQSKINSGKSSSDSLLNIYYQNRLQAKYFILSGIVYQKTKPWYNYSKYDFQDQITMNADSLSYFMDHRYENLNSIAISAGVTASIQRRMKEILRLSITYQQGLSVIYKEYVSIHKNNKIVYQTVINSKGSNLYLSLQFPIRILRFNQQRRNSSKEV